MFITASEIKRCPFNNFQPCARYSCACFRWDTPPVFVPDTDKDGNPILDECNDAQGHEDLIHPSRKGHCGLAGETRR